MNEKGIVDNKISQTISQLILPYIEDYYQKIIGIYLYPYHIGENERIEVVVVHNYDNGIPIINKTKLVYGYLIYDVDHHMSLYKEKYDEENYFKLIKELKNGYIIYDPKHTLLRRQKELSKDSNLNNLYNFIELPNEVVDDTKKMIKSINQ